MLLSVVYIKVLEVGLKGRVKWYSVLGHYGFIARADGKPDIFVHQSAISKSQTEKFYLRTLADDEPVEFDIVEGRKGPEASNVTGPNGGNVRGSRYQRVLLYRFRPPRYHVSHGKDSDRRRGATGNQAKITNDEEWQKGPLHGRRHGRRFRPRRSRQPQGNGVVEHAPTGAEATTDVEATITIKPSPRRRNNYYYNRRFRRQKVEPKQGDDVGKEKMNASNSSGLAAESENGQDEEKAGIRRRTEGEKEAELKATEMGGGDADPAGCKRSTAM
ncbi:unnamed protein product [Angiostrongylus costaricensis]|uniref:CSD_1 domain-containing protein n=1 Tax=Angiostrongylus costaricensis TaxID=334426 RepID=A0A0R3PMQ4_ANGCS|nr:unnamed protein product [Angiostrongylus costaricensis]